MTQEYFVKLVSRGGELLQRYGFNELPIHLGRAYNNHIILDDPYTAAHHAVILRNDHGELVIRELHTQNGIFIAASVPRNYLSPATRKCRSVTPICACACRTMWWRKR